MSGVPSTTWRMLTYGARGPELPRGLDAAWSAATGWMGRLVARRKRFLDRARTVLSLEGEYKDVTDAKLREMVQELRGDFLRGRETPEQLNHAFAMVREVAYRQLGMRPFLVQVAGALALEAGCIVEMATGEGKTLTATLPATIFGWRGKGCHVITHNDYLVKRDAEWMSPVYRFCGLRTGHIEQDMDPGGRRQAYHADITYCTNKECCADFLRDRLALGRHHSLPQVLLAKIAAGARGSVDGLVQRGLHYALVDEADSLLIDEAVTPLIISGDVPNEEQVHAYAQAAQLARQLELGGDYRVNERYREIDITNNGRRRLAELAEPYGGIWAGARRREELVNQALTAIHFYGRDKQYVVQEGEVVIVDEFTGRLMPDRNWRDGLHQAVEAKEELEVNPPKDTFARVSFQRFFRLYRRMAGMTGTGIEATGEFWQIYQLPVVVVPTNRPCVREHRPDRVYATEQAKWNAIVAEIREVHKTGRPILVGTRSVGASELLSRLLQDVGLEHQVLNAVRHAEEAQITAAAGQEGRITVATNMAGRGTDIKLGRGVADLGGLHVLATERHESGRIDRQLYGRAGRQGDPGSAQAFVSLEDELVRRYAPHLSASFRKRHGRGEGEISSRSTRWLFDAAQRHAQRMALRQRKGVLKTDDWLDEYLGFAGSEG
ncbi:MAG: preprotein translocase subunit SecA [Phycisphaerae bacterium]